jgi:hypothetical protein
MATYTVTSSKHATFVASTIDAVKFPGARCHVVRRHTRRDELYLRGARPVVHVNLKPLVGRGRCRLR